VKILRPGREQKGWAIKTKCTGAGNGNGGCGAELLVEQGDLYRTQSQARDETTYYTTFKCAACGVQTDLADSKVPSNIRHALSLRLQDGTLVPAK
jgi:hypothetical protein